MSTSTQRLQRFSRFLKPANVILMIVLVGVTIRLIGWDSQSLSNDEVLELEIARLPVSQISVASDGFPPLYHILLKSWIGFFQTEDSARILSIVLASITLAAMWLYARTILPERYAVWPVLLLSFSAYHTWHSQEARAHSAYFLLVVLALWLFSKVRSHPSWKNWLIFSLVCGAGVLVHYYFSFLLLAMLAAQLIPGRSESPLWSRILPFLLIAVLCLPVLFFVLGDLQFQDSMTSQTPFSIYAFGYTFFVFIAGYSLGPSIRELHWLQPNDAVLQGLPWLVLAGVPALYLVWMALRKVDAQCKSEVRVQMGLGITVVLIGALASVVTNVGYKTQYVLPAMPPLLLVLGAGIGVSIKRLPGLLSLVTLIVLSIVSLHNRIAVPRYQNEDIRGISEALVDTGESSQPVLVTAGYMAHSLDYYLGSDWNVVPLPFVDNQESGLENALTAIESAVGSDPSRRFWLVYSRVFHGDPGGTLKRVLLERQQISLDAELAGVELYRGSLE